MQTLFHRLHDHALALERLLAEHPDRHWQRSFRTCGGPPNSS
jgi:hypothetical protein